MSPLKSFECSICGAEAPKRYLADSKFTERMRWLRRHRAKKHPQAFKKSIKRGVATRKTRGSNAT